MKESDFIKIPPSEYTVPRSLRLRSLFYFHQRIGDTMTSYRHISTHALQQVVNRLTGGYFAMNAYAEANKGTNVESDMRHGADSLKTCMVILIGEEQTNVCIDTMRKALSDQEVN